jgi:phosphoribosylaminoimidazole-succinocarboxamide synthase
MTLGWYQLFSDLKTHFVSADHDEFPEPFKGRQELAGRSMLVRKANRYDVECVVRGYLAGSGWREYKVSQSVCGVNLPAGLTEASRLDEPIFTPATKATDGHDENISFERMTKIVPLDIATELKRMSLDIYKRAHAHAKECGIVLADTKFEFGEIDGNIAMIDEMLSPDSSRFWPADSFEPGRSQHSFDKQFVRDYLDETGWDHNPPGPNLPTNIIEKTVERYREACQRLFPDMKLEKYL